MPGGRLAQPPHASMSLMLATARYNVLSVLWSCGKHHALFCNGSCGLPLILPAEVLDECHMHHATHIQLEAS